MTSTLNRANVGDRMLKFIKPQSKGVPPERLKKQKELFAYNESCFHGFPAKPSALAWDEKLHLLGLATRNGLIRVYGSPGVEFYGVHENTDSPVNKLCFLSGQGCLVSLCEDNSLHLWKIKMEGGKDSLVKQKSTSLEGKLKKISAIVPDTEGNNLLIGTEGGNIYLLNLSSFSMSPDIIYQDVVMQNVPEDYKLNPGPVEVIATNPLENEKILIGYQRGLIVYWDIKGGTAEMTYVSTQQLECLCWNANATEFMSSHNDGSYMVWSIADSDECKEGPTTVYGPFPCKPISKIRWFSNDGLTVFGGGMPRANYGDRHTVTVMQGDEHVTFTLTSRVIDFEVTRVNENGPASTVIILAEEEIVYLDLTSEGWPAYNNPYLSSLHTSAITCSHFVNSVDADLFDRLRNIGNHQRLGISTKAFPIDGGSPMKKLLTQRDILLTGHEDGTVRFWDASGSCLVLIYKLSTAELFISDEYGDNTAEEDDWPPFRKVGLFDPYSDDPRLGVKKMEMCPYQGTLVIGGTAGQIIVMDLESKQKEITTQSIDVNLVADNDNFSWKSHQKLDMRKDAVTYSPGMQPVVVLQFYPPASCTSLNVHSEWGLLAAGTAHGFSLFDFIVKKNLLAKSTLSPLDLAIACDEGPLSRRKSLKKSLRESFRRLRRGRSQKKPKQAPPVALPNNRNVKSSGDDSSKPVERAVEERNKSPDYIGSMVRCLRLTKCYLASNQLMSATLWAGTNSGSILVYTIAIPPMDKRAEVPLTVQLGKEIHLKHAAPVVNIMILDALSNPFPPPMAVKKGAAKAPDTTGPHRVLISSEEQFKVFTLPQLKHFCKYKLTAHEGSRVRKMGVAKYVSKADPNVSECCFMAVTNLGDFSVYSLPDSRKQVQAQCIKKEDIGGINSVVFSSRGEALFLSSASEITRISLSAKHITQPRGTLKGVLKDKIIDEETKATEESPKGTSSKKETGDVRCENGDTSVLSGDITIDSIRDHMDEMKIMEKVPEETVVEAAPMEEPCESAPPSSDGTTDAKSGTTTVSTVTKEETVESQGGTTIVASGVMTVKKSTSVQESSSSSVQVVETRQTEETTVNGVAEETCKE